MQEHTVILGGLEHGYMVKLAPYLQERFAGQLQVGISEQERPKAGAAGWTVWVGSEEFMSDLCTDPRPANRIILSEREEEDELHLFRYQSRDKLYRGILKRCRRMEGFRAAEAGTQKTRWLAVTASETVGSLLAFSMVCARVLSEKVQVLFVPLLECCGMEELFAADPRADFSDLCLELRENKSVCMEDFLCSVGGVDCLMPAKNPMVFYEMGAQDMENFLRLLRGEEKYEWIVFAVGNLFCGCDRIFSSAEKIFHLTGNGIANGCAARDRERFLRRCRQDETGAIVTIPAPEESGKICGPHLIDDWAAGRPGQIAKRYLRGGGEAKTEESGGTYGEDGA